MYLGVSQVEMLLRAAHAPSSVAAAWAGPVHEALKVGEIDTPILVGHFIAQIGHETDSFRTMREYASGRAYNGRRDLGNHLGANYGVRYRGRGLIQLTGFYNYSAFQKWLAQNGHPVNVVNQPELVEQMPYAALAAVWYWTVARNINAVARVLGDTEVAVRRITKIINGGYNGIDHRLSLYRSVMAEIRRLGFTDVAAQVSFEPPPAPEPPPPPIIEQMERVAPLDPIIVTRSNDSLWGLILRFFRGR